jgi:nicotinamidase-related amidase
MSHLALLIIDMQQAYFNDPHLKNAKDELIDRCNTLVACAKRHDVPIYNIRTEHAADRSTWTLNMKQDGKEFLVSGSDEVTPVAGLEINGLPEITKTRDSAFFETDLAEKLHQQGVRKLIICGVSTHSCVSQTAADAYAADFEVVLARDVIATHDPDYHQLSLDILQKEYRQTLGDMQAILALIEKNDRST